MFGNIMPRSSYRTAYFIALSSKKLHMLFKEKILKMINSLVEYFLYTKGVVGSIPTSSNKYNKKHFYQYKIYSKFKLI